VTVACEILGLARSTYYYESQERDETAVEAAIKAVVAEWPTYGERRGRLPRYRDDNLSKYPALSVHLPND
jgi:hypothetical protein